MITIFTPTYNRAYKLPRLYDSLCSQTSNDFEWVIVDDGSTDNTEELIKSYITENKVRIHYIKQGNGGKHRAINRGVKEANGELFFIVDSDDYLTNDAVSFVKEQSLAIIDNAIYAGLSGVRITPQGNKIGGEMPNPIYDCTMLDFRIKYAITGDMAEIYKTSVMRHFPFPEVDGERFCPEALVWDRIANDGLILRFINKGIYVCEYIEDGLTAHIVKVRHNSPILSMMHYSEYYRMNLPFRIKVKTAINFWRFAPLKYYKKAGQMRMINCLSLIMMPLGWLMRLNDSRKL